MSQRVILVHYHEIGLKGKNRSTFENRLVANLDRTLRGLPVARIGRISGHVLVTLLDDSAIEPAAALIAQVPGVARVSLAYRCNRVEQEWCDAAVEALSRVRSFESFKVHARKSATDYELHTLDINRIAGAALCDAFPDKRVEMHGPDVIVYVYVVQGDVYVYADASSTIGVGGLPVGSAGKVVTLLSSGFDSPVATWMLGRRGAVCVPVHFSGRPITTDESEWLCRDIIEQLRPAGIVGRMYVVPFGECQHEIALATPQSLRVIMYRRMMISVAERIAKIEGAKAIVTGESLGQVASQTLENIAAVNECVELPVFRPLIGSDKQEIIARAHQLGTFDICCQTAPDCCTLFMPRRPETHARLDDVHAAWDLFDHDAMVEQLVENVEYIDFEGCPSYRAPKTMRTYHHELGPATLR